LATDYPDDHPNVKAGKQFYSQNPWPELDGFKEETFELRNPEPYGILNNKWDKDGYRIVASETAKLYYRQSSPDEIDVDVDGIKHRSPHRKTESNLNKFYTD